MSMEPQEKKKGFINYPDPLPGPDVPYENDRKSNPAMTGPMLAFCAVMLEYLGFVRQLIWHNAGFSMLRKIRLHLEDYEPLYEPTVIPTTDSLTTSENGGAVAGAVVTPTPSSSRYPASRYYSVVDYRELFLSGELTPVEVAAALLPLIRKDANPKSPYSIAWFETQVERVMEAAEASTLRYKEKRSLGPLDGIPTGVKDEYELDGYQTCLGSRNNYTEPTVEGKSNASWCVRKLQEAGCVILGKLHMVEFGLDTPGSNPIHGTPPNPYNEKYYTGGSSSGSAYAVSAGLIPIALGSDGGGSIRIPAAFCSVFGLKPSHGRLSFWPGQNHCKTCAVLGPIAADIRSLATVYEVIGQPPHSSPFPPVPPVQKLLARASSLPKVLGIPEAWFARSTPAVKQLCMSMVDDLVEKHGYRTIPIDIPFLTEGQVAHAMTVLNDAATLLPETSNLTSTTRILLALGRTTPSTDFTLAQKLRRLLVQHLAHLWRDNPGMVIVTPTSSCAGWPVRKKAELKWGLSDADTTLQTMEYVWLANFCGLPSLTVPAGYVVPEGRPGAGEVAEPDCEGKVPVGLMTTGEWGSEAELLQIGLDSEEVGAARRARPPIWVDTVELAKEKRNERRVAGSA